MHTEISSRQPSQFFNDLYLDLMDVEPADFTFEPRDTVVYLTGVSVPMSRGEKRHNLGLLMQPASHVETHWEDYEIFGADNGCFAEAQGKPWDADLWLTWVIEQVVPRADRCMFVVAPDVVGDAAATIERSAPYLEVIRKLGLPAAFVAQDGLENLEVPWDTFDVLFIGGSTEWKLSEAAYQLTVEARSRGKWIHMGRVNSWTRIEIAVEWGVDSVDGTYLAFGPTKNFPNLVGWLDRLDRHQADDAEVAAGELTLVGSIAGLLV